MVNSCSDTLMLNIYDRLNYEAGRVSHENYLYWTSEVETSEVENGIIQYIVKKNITFWHSISDTCYTLMSD